MLEPHESYSYTKQEICQWTERTHSPTHTHVHRHGQTASQHSGKTPILKWTWYTGNDRVKLCMRRCLRFWCWDLSPLTALFLSLFLTHLTRFTHYLTTCPGQQQQQQTRLVLHTKEGGPSSGRAWQVAIEIDFKYVTLCGYMSVPLNVCVCVCVCISMGFLSSFTKSELCDKYAKWWQVKQHFLPSSLTTAIANTILTKSHVSPINVFACDCVSSW